MPKRKAEDEAQASTEEPKGPKKGRKQQQKPLKVPLYKASVVRSASADTFTVADEAIVQKIKKCLDRGNHPNTPENEAKAALHLASRWMATHNVSQAQIFAQEKAEDLSQHSGQCDVSILRSDADSSKSVVMQGHMVILCDAVEILFDCKSYSTRDIGSLTMSFYGIEANAMAAADAFEMVFNLVAQWSMKNKGNGPRGDYCIGIGDELCAIARRTKRAEEAQSIKTEEATRVKEEEKEAAEEQARLSRLSPPPAPTVEDAPESPPPAPAVEDAPESPPPAPTVEDAPESPQSVHHHPPYTRSAHGEAGGDGDHGPVMDEGIGDEDHSFELTWAVDDDEDNSHDPCFEATFNVEDNEDSGLDVHADLEETLEKLIKHEPRSPTNDQDLPPNTTPSKDTSPAAPDVDVWSSHSQLVLFRDKAMAIADDFLKSQGVKVYAGRKSTHKIRNWDVYREGKCDGHKIDMRGNVKRIEASKGAVVKEEIATKAEVKIKEEDMS